MKIFGLFKNITLFILGLSLLMMMYDILSHLSVYDIKTLKTFATTSFTIWSGFVGFKIIEEATKK